MVVPYLLFLNIWPLPIICSHCWLSLSLNSPSNYLMVNPTPYDDVSNHFAFLKLVLWWFLRMGSWGKTFSEFLNIDNFAFDFSICKSVVLDIKSLVYIFLGIINTWPHIICQKELLSKCFMSDFVFFLSCPKNVIGLLSETFYFRFPAHIYPCLFSFLCLYCPSLSQLGLSFSSV